MVGLCRLDFTLPSLKSLSPFPGSPPNLGPPFKNSTMNHSGEDLASPKAWAIIDIGLELYYGYVATRGNGLETQSMPTQGLVLTGSLGAGKSTLSLMASRRFQLRVMRSIVTRRLELGEDSEYIAMDEIEFLRLARMREVVLPYCFSGTWYGYSREDWESACATGGAGLLFNVRPSVGLVLAVTLVNVSAVWLEVPDNIRQVRMRERSAERDLSIGRSRLDREDKVYREAYGIVIDSSDTERALKDLALVLSKN